MTKLVVVKRSKKIRELEDKVTELRKKHISTKNKKEKKKLLDEIINLQRQIDFDSPETKKDLIRSIRDRLLNSYWNEDGDLDIWIDKEETKMKKSLEEKINNLLNDYEYIISNKDAMYWLKKALVGGFEERPIHGMAQYKKDKKNNEEIVDMIKEKNPALKTHPYGDSIERTMIGNIRKELEKGQRNLHWQLYDYPNHLYD